MEHRSKKRTIQAEVAVAGSLIILGLLSLLMLIFANAAFLRLFTSDGWLASHTLERIREAQISLSIMGLALIVLGIITGRYHLFRGLNAHKKWAGFCILILALLYLLVTGNILFHIYPLPSTREFLEQSVAYVPSPYSIHRMRELDYDVMAGDSGVVRMMLRNGYRGRSFPVHKPEGEIRIVFIGGSFVFDPDVFGENDWPHAVENRLHQAGYTRVRIINAGVPGHTTFDSITRILAEIYLYEPDYVMLCQAWNDIKYFNLISAQAPPLRVVQSLLKPTHTGYPPSALEDFLDKIYLYRLVKAIPRMKYNRADREGVPPEGEYSDRVFEAGPRQYRLNLLTFIDLCRNIGAEPVLLIQPHLVTAGNEDLVRETVSYHWVLMSHQALCDAFDNCARSMLEAARWKGCRVWDFSEDFDGRLEYFGDQIHFTPEGSRRFAVAVADSVIRDVLAPTANSKSSTYEDGF
ncbi:MAG: SGNH/GDSL hydrolase family protein [Candidatus Krumholzibacteriota bacterium]|nr:SGNH/GDSL hydrolase family protein [Candidatus Krumholzibacteriota bacterium]